MVNFCPNCWNKNEKEDIKICSKCWTRLDIWNLEKLKDIIKKRFNRYHRKHIWYLLIISFLVTTLWYYYFQSKLDNNIKDENMPWINEYETEVDDNSYSTNKCSFFDTKNYTDIKNVIFSEDGKIIVFNWRKDWKYVKVKNWVEVENEISWVDSNYNVRNRVYSSNWKSFAFVAEKDNKRFVIKDWVEIAEYSHINADSLALSPDWKDFVFVGIKEKFWESILVKNWVEMDYKNNLVDSRITNFYYPQYVNNWKSFVFFTRYDTYWYLVKDWKVIGIGNYYSDKIENPTFSPDWKSFYFTTSHWWKSLWNWMQWKVLFKIDNIAKVWPPIEIGEYDEISSLTYSPDWESFSFIAKKDGIYTVIKDGIQMGEYYNRIKEPLTYSSDGKSLAFIWKNNIEWVMVKDGQEINELPLISDYWSGESKPFYYSEETKTFNYLVLDDTNGLMLCSVRY